MISSLLVFVARILTGNALWLGCGPEPKQRIYFANHTSNLDALVIWAALPKVLRKRTRPVAAHDYWTGGKVRLYLAHKVFNAILIERKKVTARNNPIPQIIEQMEQGDSIIIFPEGKRNDGNEVGEFKSGLYHLALACPKAELVPVHLENLNRILPKGEFLPVPLLGSVRFGAPLHLNPSELKHDFLQRSRAAVQALEGNQYENR